MGASEGLAITELGLALLALWIVVYNTLQYIYLCAFFDSTDLLESGVFFLLTSQKCNPTFYMIPFWTPFVLLWPAVILLHQVVENRGWIGREYKKS